MHSLSGVIIQFLPVPSALIRGSRLSYQNLGGRYFPHEGRLLQAAFVFLVMLCYNLCHMQKSVYQQRRENAEKKKAVALYKKGYSTRQTSELLSTLYGIKRSRMWVCRAVKEAGIDLSGMSS